ncbi:MAG: helix-turn-helix domain-containing protein [Treponema sp.]|nr:helix-turn-helix domain-containing protein [Treponema sp.]
MVGANERIRAIRKALKLTQVEFASRLGMQAAALSMIEVGENLLTEKNIRLIVMNFNVSEDWLRSGSGEMFVAPPFEKEFFEVYSKLLPETQDALLRLAKDLLAVERKLAGHTQDPNHHTELSG